MLTHNRPELLKECVDAVASQVDAVCVIDNASDPPATARSEILVRVPDQPPNLSHLWNIGIDVASEHGAEYIAFLCDDAIVPDGWFAAVVGAMRLTGAAVGCSHPGNTWYYTNLKTEHDHDVMNRMPGWAFVLDASKGIRADERLHWWYCDTAIDWIARHRGGMVMVGGYPVPNMRPNDFTNTRPELAARAGLDGQLFAQLYGGGRTPW